MIAKRPRLFGRKSAVTAIGTILLLSACADAEGPKARDVNIPAPQSAETRRRAVNERPDPIMYLPLGEDVLLPESEPGDPLPSNIVGPFELRSESLAGALQLILDGNDIPVSYETSRGLDNSITVTNLKGPLNEVVQQVCGLADLYCSYQRGMLNVKDTQIFTVAIPPIAAADQVGQLMTNVAGAIAEITGSTPIVDPSTRTIVYRATARTSEIARRYFQRLRQNTAMIVFETYIWEVALNTANSTGINWQYFDKIGKFNFGLSAAGTVSPDLGTPVSIGLPTTGAVDLATGDVLRFISTYGAVKTISQPQITVLAGAEARLRVADTQNYLASVSRTITDGGTTTTSTTTDSVDSGFTLVIGSNWDNATIYGNINILLQEVRAIDQFVASDEATIQLPSTSERELQTQVRVRPGDSLLIAGLVRERDNLDSRGPGISEPIIPTDRTAQADNVELVFLLRPRVVVYTSAPNPVLRPLSGVPQAVLNAQALQSQATAPALSETSSVSSFPEIPVEAAPLTPAPDIPPPPKQRPTKVIAPMSLVPRAAPVVNKSPQMVQKNAAVVPLNAAGLPSEPVPQAASNALAPMPPAAAAMPMSLTAPEPIAAEALIDMPATGNANGSMR